MNWVRAFVGVLVLWSSTAWGATLTWTANSEPDLAGYRVYYCSLQPCTQSSGNASLLVTLGTGTSFNIGTPAVTQYYFITAYDSANLESGSSNLATVTPAGSPPPPPSPVGTVNLDGVVHPSSLSLEIAGAPNIPLSARAIPVTVRFTSGTPTSVQLSVDGFQPWATWPTDAFFTLSPDGTSLTGNMCRTFACLQGQYKVNVVATYATGATATAAVMLNVN
jgi:hypothetical protein